MFSVEFAIVRRKESKSASAAAQLERLSCDRSGDLVDAQIKAKRRFGSGCWGRLIAALGVVHSDSVGAD
jgi:hypothetical protein